MTIVKFINEVGFKVAVGVEHDHDEVWQEAFDKIFEEYNRIGSQMFPNGEQCVMDDPDEK